MREGWCVDFNTTTPIELSSISSSSSIIEIEEIESQVVEDDQNDSIKNTDKNHDKRNDNRNDKRRDKNHLNKNEESINIIAAKNGDNEEKENFISIDSDTINEEECDKIVFTLSCSEQGQIGVFPEQQENWKWISNTIKKSFIKTLKVQTNEKLLLRINDETLSDDYTESRRIPFISKKNPIKKNVKNEKIINENSHNENESKNKNKNNKDKKVDLDNLKSLEVVTRVLNGFAYTGGSSLASLSVHNEFTSGTYLFLFILFLFSFSLLFYLLNFIFLDFLFCFGLFCFVLIFLV